MVSAVMLVTYVLVRAGAAAVSSPVEFLLRWPVSSHHASYIMISSASTHSCVSMSQDLMSITNPRCSHVLSRVSVHISILYICTYDHVRKLSRLRPSILFTPP